MADKPKIHDYTLACWGHSIVHVKEVDGTSVRCTGFGPLSLGLPKVRIKAGDLIKAKSSGGASLYRVAEIEYRRDPPDMWTAVIRYDEAASKEHLTDEERNDHA